MAETTKMRVSYFNGRETDSKLMFVKTIKEYSRDTDGVATLGLKECKDFVDSIGRDGTSEYFDINVLNTIDKTSAIRTFANVHVNIKFIDRERKLKRILYADQETLIEDMLMEKWENYVDDKDLETLTYKQCKEIAVKKIIKEYSEYINYDFFTDLTKDIHRINQHESKDIGFKFMKFNEEFGEFNAEYIKFKGFTYKEYNRDELLGEMADSLQVLLSIYDHIAGETNITIKDVLEKISEKNIKWETKIKEYKKNKRN